MKIETLGSKNEYDKFRREISLLPDNAFDGHTCFKELTPRQRLDWLAELVVFVYEAGQIRSSQIR